MLYEIERIYLTDDTGQPEQFVEDLITIDAESAAAAAVAFVERDRGRLLGTVCTAAGDQCTAAGWREGRLYAITVWRAGHAPIAPRR
jgi:hypothetical protein